MKLWKKQMISRNSSRVLLSRRNSQPNEAEEFQKLLFNLLGGAFNGGNNAENSQFMEDFQKGFNTGCAASDQYAQRTTNTSQEPLGVIPQFLFGKNSCLSFIFTRILLCMFTI